MQIERSFWSWPLFQSFVQRDDVRTTETARRLDASALLGRSREGAGLRERAIRPEPRTIKGKIPRLLAIPLRGNSRQTARSATRGCPEPTTESEALSRGKKDSKAGLL